MPISEAKTGFVLEFYYKNLQENNFYLQFKRYFAILGYVV